MSMPNYKDITTVKKRPGIKSFWKLLAAIVYHYWLQMEFATQHLIVAKYQMFSPASEIMCVWKQRVVYWHKMPNDILSLPRQWKNSSRICQRPLQILLSFQRVWNLRWKISDMSF